MILQCSLISWNGFILQEVSNFENGKLRKKKSSWRFTSENKIFEGKPVNDTFWQEFSKAENHSHARTLCQLKDLNEDDFLLNTKMHMLQEEKIQEPSYQGFHIPADLPLIVENRSSVGSAHRNAERWL
ncbi:PREDICTED: putative uncharacterized protein ENSP00000383407 [Chinchilla lanigera]|uniref:putative uncharacterized protein ENSP00000383407 n=1 Tax=Chinchilla lanigera TaxID=34839 RepID=UPI0006981C43|nr:PREDICTED: putative uncharacterized protein ENSP00000383407 [Chinchilla lanigera]